MWHYWLFIIDLIWIWRREAVHLWGLNMHKEVKDYWLISILTGFILKRKLSPVSVCPKTGFLAFSHTIWCNCLTRGEEVAHHDGHVQQVHALVRHLGWLACRSLCGLVQLLSAAHGHMEVERSILQPLLLPVNLWELRAQAWHLCEGGRREGEWQWDCRKGGDTWPGGPHSGLWRDWHFL